MPQDDPKLTDEVARLAALDRYRLRQQPDDRLGEFQSITDLVADLFGVAMCSISIINDDVQYFAAVTGEEPGLTPRSEAVCNQTIKDRGPLVIEDLSADPRFADASFVTDQRHFRSYAGVPLTTPDGYNLGALCVIDRETREFSMRERNLLDRFAKVVVEQMELRTLAHQDYLTGVLSRRAFTDRAKQVLHQTAREDSDAALIAFDIDHFKTINDGFGHAMGDSVLRAIAAHARSVARASHHIGRIGGEEFAIVLPNVAVSDAHEMAERLRREFEAMGFPHGQQVTSSFGVAMGRGHDDFDRWLESADEALYQAKRSGRNRTVVAGTPRAAA